MMNSHFENFESSFQSPTPSYDGGLTGGGTNRSAVPVVNVCKLDIKPDCCTCYFFYNSSTTVNKSKSLSSLLFEMKEIRRFECLYQDKNRYTRTL